MLPERVETPPGAVRVRELGTVGYADALDSMRRFTAARGPATVDEIWLLEHPPVYTLGLNGREAHVLDAGTIPLCRSDRGGQVTYHGPGQLVVYVLLDLARRGLGPRRLVHLLEQAVIDLCAGLGVAAGRRAGAPGVYVGAAKLAALGLRVRRGCSYHGLALNVDLDLSPYRGIDPCGYAGLAVTRLRDLGVGLAMAEIRCRIVRHLLDRLGDLHPETGAPNARHAA
jgi:lipoyl(octanoyl) transferase